MSLSITNEPYQYTPSGNDMVFILSSTNAGNTGFKYYIDITPDGEDTITLDALPNTNGYGVFNIKRIIESYISFDIKMSINTVDYRTNDNKRFNVRTYSTWTGGSEKGETKQYYAWPAAFGVIEFNSYSQPDYVVTSGNLGSAQFLSNRTSMKVQSGDTGCLYFNDKRYANEGTQIIQNSGFTTMLNWTTTGSMSITNTFTGFAIKAAGSIGRCYQNVGSNFSSVFKITVFVIQNTGTTACKVKVSDGLTDHDLMSITGIGTFTCYFYADASPFNTIEIYGDSNAAFIVDSITCEVQYKEITGVVYNAYDDNGTLINNATLTTVGYDVYTEENYHKMFCAVPSGPSNIASGIDANFLTGASYYTINLTGPDGDACTMRYNIDTKCSPYTKKRIHYMNKLGGFDAYNFTLKNRKSFTTERAKYGKRIGIETGGVWRVHNYDQGITQHYANYQEKWVLNSDWLTDEEQEALMELFVSPVIFWETAGTYYPLIIDSNEYKVNTRLTDGLTQLELTVMLTHKNTTQLL